MSAPTDEIFSQSRSSHTHVQEDKSWKPERSCQEHLARLNDCKSLLGKFNHYYVYGDSQDCERFKTGYENCIGWEKTQCVKSRAKLEELQKQEHIKRTRYPPMWEMRSHPPANWNAKTDKSSLSTDVPTIVS